MFRGNRNDAEWVATGPWGRRGQSIRINQQWRICFHWIDGEAEDVEICDYH